MDIAKLISNFKKNNYLVQYFENDIEAIFYLSSQVIDKVVGFGDSQTINSLKLNELLSKKNIVYDPQSTFSNTKFLEIAKKSLTSEIFITSVNAFSFTGELVNIDGTGNRIASSLFGHEKVFFIIGVNKFEENLEKAIWRARNIAAPKNAKRLGLKTPCALKGDKCYNCSANERICNALTIYFKAMDNIRSEIIFINKNLGL